MSIDEKKIVDLAQSLMRQRAKAGNSSDSFFKQKDEKSKTEDETKKPTNKIRLSSDLAGMEKENKAVLKKRVKVKGTSRAEVVIRVYNIRTYKPTLAYIHSLMG